MTDRAADQRMWGGRFTSQSDPLFREFNDSLPIDCALVQEDIAASIAWAESLRDAGMLTADECHKIGKVLEEIGRIAESPVAFAGAKDEDIHGWVERELIERVGDLGKKLHTGRSRNDQVATDLRLWARRVIEGRISEIRTAQRALVNLAEREIETIVPGYTHLQRAQPVLFAHWCLAYFEMLDRDVARFKAGRDRADACPLGSAALAGSSFAVDREALAKTLGFARPTANSLDAVSDRDFVLDLLGAATTCALHLSRLAEDLICYASAEFGFVELSDAVTSGSSIMPQKKNPDALELIRGKTGAIFGSYAGFMMTVKGTPLAYNKDFQEDKRPVFLAMNELSLCLRMCERTLRDLRTNPDACRRAAEGGYMNATAFANYLVMRGVPFREAHEITGRAVLRAIEKKVPLEKLAIDDLRRFNKVIERDIFDAIVLDRVIACCDVYGGTAPNRVKGAIKEARERLARP